MKRKLQAAYHYLRTQGLRRFCAAVYFQLQVSIRIYFRGRNRTVTFDGCRFPLRGLANTPMKLALLDGDYEAPERAAVRKYLQPGWGVVEFGACIGVVSCITNKLLGNPEAHVVVEINPLAIPHLQANRDRNGCSFRIVNAALAYDAPEVSFRPHFDLWANFLEQRGNRPSVSIPATRLQRILDEERFTEFALICDIEGQEHQLVTHEAEALGKAALIVMELHPVMLGEERVRALLSKLAELGFRIIERTRDVVVLAKSPKPLSTATPAPASTSLSS